MTQYAMGLEMGARQYLRNGLFIALLIIMPPAFITLSFLTTPDAVLPVVLLEDGIKQTVVLSMPDLHGALMVPITTAFLSGFVGLFVMFSAREGDRRLVIAGFSLPNLLAVRITMIVVLSLAITLLSVGVTLISFRPEQIGTFFLINLISALQYAFLGAVAGTFLNAISGTYLMFFAPMIDVGIVQNPMFPRESVQWWAKLLPGYAPMEVLTDIAFTPGFDTWGFLGLSALYAAAIGAVAAVLFIRVTAARK